MLHDGGQLRFDGYEPAGAIYQYPIDQRYARWYAGDALECYDKNAVEIHPRMK